jgi:hypothetical protein
MLAYALHVDAAATTCWPTEGRVAAAHSRVVTLAKGHGARQTPGKRKSVCLRVPAVRISVLDVCSGRCGRRAWLTACGVPKHFMAA